MDAKQVEQVKNVLALQMKADAGDEIAETGFAEELDRLTARQYLLYLRMKEQADS